MWRAIQLASPSRFRLRAVSHTRRINHAQNFRGRLVKRLRRCWESLRREGIFRTYPAARKRTPFRDCCFSASWLDFSAIALGSNLTESGGEGGIRTLGTLTGTPDFESGTIDHSATSPQGSRNGRFHASKRKPKMRPFFRCPGRSAGHHLGVFVLVASRFPASIYRKMMRQNEIVIHQPPAP
jgi:hypothetical protein